MTSLRRISLVVRVARLAPIVLALACSCDRGPPVWAPSPYASSAAPEGCVRARALIARAPALLDEGRVDRAARALTRAEDLCPTEAPATWGKRVTALALLGRSAEALQLARRIEGSDRASEADRAAAAAARVMAEEHGRAVAAAGSRRDDPELFDPAEKRRERAADLFRRGVAAARSKDAAGAKKLFLDAWGEWHPNPHALAQAGLAAEALGDRVEAQRLWDRAAYDDAASAPRPEIPLLAPRAVSGAVIAWDAEARRVAVGGDEEIAVYDADLSPTARIHTGEGVTAVAFAPGGGSIVAALAGGKIRVFDVALGMPRGELRPGRARGVTRVIAPSPARLIALAGDEPGLALWDVAANAAGRAFSSSRPIVAAAWSARGDRIAWADDAGAVAVADPESGAVQALSRARGAVRALSFDGDALLVVTAGERLRYDLARPRVPARVIGRGRVDAASFAGSAVAVRNATSLGLEEAGSSIWSVPGAAEHGGALALAASPDRAVAVVFRDRTISLIRGPDRASRRDLSPASPILAFAASPSGKQLAAAAEDGRVLLWSLDPLRITSFSAPGTRALAFSPDGRTLAVGVERRVELRDAVTGQGTPSIDITGRVEMLSFSADGMRLAVGTDAPALLLFAAGSREPMAEQRFDGGPLRAARFTPDGKSLLVAAHEGVVLWSPESRRVHRFTRYGPEPRDVALTADGSGMIVSDKRGALLFGRPAESAPAPSSTLAVSGQALSIAAIPNGLFATAEGDRTLTLRGPNGKPVQRFREPDAAVRAVTALPQGLLAASFADGALRLFRSPVPVAVTALRPAPGLPPSALAGLILAPSGHFDVVGPDAALARAALRCRLGAALYPIQVCAEQFAMSGLVPLVLAAQDPVEADP